MGNDSKTAGMATDFQEQPKTCTIRDRKFIHHMPPWDAEGYAKSFEKALKVTDKKLDVMREAWESGDEETARHLVSDLLTTKRSKMAAVMRYAFKQAEQDRPTLDECIKCTQMLDLKKPLKESAKVYAKKKFGKDDWRPIADFGIQHRTAQEMVKAVLGRVFKPRPFQFTTRSVPEAIARVRAKAEAGNYYFVQQDISGFFLHFEEEGLKVALPLPTWAVGHVVMGRQTKWAPRGGQIHPFLYVSCDELIDQARRGIPQGSSTSPIIAMIECAKLELSHELESALFNYADDFLSLFKTAQEAESAAGELQDAVVDLPGGNFTLKLKGIGHLSEGCTFLGHHIQLVDGVIRISPSETNLAKLVGKFHQLQEQCGVFSTGVIGEKVTKEQKKKVLQAIADSRHYLKSWLAAFKECNELDNSLINECGINIEMMMTKIGATPEDLVAFTGSETFSIEYSGWQ